MISLREAIIQLKQNNLNTTELSVNLENSVENDQFIEFSQLLSTNQTIKSLSILGISNAISYFNNLHNHRDEPKITELPNSIFKNLTIIEIKFPDDSVNIFKTSKLFMKFCIAFNKNIKNAQSCLNNHKLKTKMLKQENIEFMTDEIIKTNEILEHVHAIYLILINLSKEFKNIESKNNQRIREYLAIKEEVNITLACIYSQNPETFSEAYKTLRMLPDSIKTNQILFSLLLNLANYEQIINTIFENEAEFSMLQLILFLHGEKPERFKNYIYYHLKKIESSEANYSVYTGNTDDLEKLILSAIPPMQIISLKAKAIQKLDYFFFIDTIKVNIKEKKLFIHTFLTAYAKYNSEIAIFLGDYFAYTNEPIKASKNNVSFKFKLTYKIYNILDAVKYYTLALELEHPQAPQKIYTFCKSLKEQYHNKEFVKENINFLSKKIENHADNYVGFDIVFGKFYFFIIGNKKRGTEYFHKAAKNGNIDGLYYLLYLATNEINPQKHIQCLKEFIDSFYNNENKELIHGKAIKALSNKNIFKPTAELFKTLEKLMFNSAFLAIKMSELYKNNSEINSKVYCYYLACNSSCPIEFSIIINKLFELKLTHPESKANFYLRKIHNDLINLAQPNDKNIHNKLIYFYEFITEIADKNSKFEDFTNEYKAYFVSTALIFEYIYRDISKVKVLYNLAQNQLELKRTYLKKNYEKPEVSWKKIQEENIEKKVITFLKNYLSPFHLFSLFSPTENGIINLIKKLEQTKYPETEGMTLLIRHAKIIFEKNPDNCDEQLIPIFFALDKLRHEYYKKQTQTHLLLEQNLDQVNDSNVNNTNNFQVS